ncbi:MAG: ribonuclease HII [Smithella sp.]
MAEREGSNSFIFSMNTFEKIAYKEGYKFVAGVDEAGRGPLAGPVVAAAVILPPDYMNAEINDSKQLSAAKREKLYEIINKDAVSIGTGIVDTEIIDHLNILQATLQAMREAVLELPTSPDFLLIDGLHRVPVITPQKPVVKGDSLSISIAAASIIAKVSRDRIMEIYHRQFPQYNFRQNKGYGTKEHCDAIKQFGICKIHRKSFHVKNLNQTTLQFTI